MVGAHTTFSNDRFPRATNPDLSALLPSSPDDQTLPTLVRRGATIGAAVSVVPGRTIGEWAMVGMGRVVTRDVGAHQLVLGNPARPQAYVCRCGPVLAPFAAGPAHDLGPTGRRCERCGGVLRGRWETSLDR